MLPWSLAILILILDQWTKLLIRHNFYYGEIRPVVDGFFNLVYVRNDGAAWNILSGQSWILISISIGVLVFLTLKARKELMRTRTSRILYGFLLGGIGGNLVERIRFGWVTDFLDFQFGSYHYPSFNIADSMICISAIFYFFYYKKESIHKKESNE